MGITNKALNSLRRVFGVDRAERDRAESPSSDAMRYNPSSTYSIWGREDIGGLLSVSQNLMDRFADYEAMNDYPDIRCFTGDMKVYVVDESNVIVPTTFKKLATDGDGWEILAFDRKKERIVKVAAESPRLTGRNAPILKLSISNGEALRVTANHKILTREKGYIEAKDLRKGDFVIGARAGFETNSRSMLTVNQAGGYWITNDPKPDGVDLVYDVTTSTKNLLVNGVICHNSAFHYFANDATQPNLDNNRVVWVQSPDEALVDAADTLITRRLRLEDELFSIAYTLCQYGNDIEEVLVTENGVVGLNALPAPTMRRIEKNNGNLIGFVQDITGKFTSNQDELRKMLGGNLEIPKHIALFEDWQVCHFRLRGTSRRSPYGVCIPADGLVATVDGPKPIIDVKIGDRVFCRHSGMLRTTKVIDHVSNGVRPVFKLKTTHREIRATGNHPFLTRVGGINRWKPLEELRVGDEIVAAATVPGLGNAQPLGRRLREFDDQTSIQLTSTGIDALLSASKREKYGSRDAGLRKVFADQGLSRKQMSDILEGSSSIQFSAYKAILATLGLVTAVDDFKVYHGSAATVPTLPDFVDEKFCRFLGFMLGNGWVTDQQIYFARGVDEDVNEFYEDYFREIGLDPSRTNNSTQCFVNSTVMVKLLRDLDWINGCKEKRVPSWVFAQDVSLRRALVRGLVDSNGWCAQQTKERFHIELANHDLVRDIKTLVDGLGWTCGNIRTRAPREGKIRKGLVHYHSGKVQEEDQIIKGGPTYTITWHETPLGADNFAIEKIKSIDFDCDEEVYDIGVADTDHNFLCNGLVVHNSTAEGARWIWKRLVMLEDAVMIYKLCLRGDSQIWTPEGRKAIKDLEEGDEVYSYTTEDRLKKTKVVYKKHNGRDTIYRVFSDHREIFANKTHPVLVETIIGQGGGKPRIRRLDYVEVQNLKPGVHRLVTPKKNEDDWKEIKLKKPELHSKARLSSPEQVKRRISYPRIAKEIGVHHYRARDFFVGDYELKTDTAVALLDANGYGPEHLEVEEHWGGESGLPVKGVTIPATVTEEFAQWWGFMLGDGFITTRHHKQRPGHTVAHTAQNEVGFALGADSAVNARYKALFEQWVPEAKHVGDSGGRLGAYSFVSSKFAEFMCLNGFIPGTHHKRLPEWIFRAHPKIKLAMIRGLADADAHIRPRNVSEVRGRVRHEVFRFEMCNEELLKDVRELAMQLGLVATFVGSRFREGGRTIKGGKPLPDGTYYLLDVSIKDQTPTELLRGVEEVGADDIWDIGVEADEHNFVADGVTVHNTRSPARYAFYVDVTDVPSNRVESFLKRAKRDLKKKKMVNPNNNFLDMRYNPLCLAGDTKIPLLDGTEKTLVEMVDAYSRGEDQWVYSVDVNDGNKLVPGKVVWAGETRKDAQLIKITLDNGESIKVTPDHKMIRRSGEFAEAQTLKVGDSLMPYYRKRGNVSPAAPDYEMVYDPSDKTYKFAHRVVSEGCGIRTGISDYVIHHEISSAAVDKLIAYNKSPAKRTKTALDNRKYNKLALMRAAITPEIREKQKEAAGASKKDFWADSAKKAEASKKMRYVYPQELIDAIRLIVEEEGIKVSIPKVVEIANQRNLIQLMKDANLEKSKKLKNIHRDMIRWICHSLGFKNFKEFKNAAPIPHNHKVAKIEWLEEKAVTYTLTVNDAHTFAVSAGVFVKNSNDEDFFIAVRDGRELSRVEVLSGPDYQCLTGNTKIMLGDGTSKTIKEMAEEGPDASWAVHTCETDGNLTLGYAHSAKMSSPDAEIWEVELSNGETVECTWHHPFLTKDGRWVFAKNLKPGQRLMTLAESQYRQDQLIIGRVNQAIAVSLGKSQINSSSGITAVVAPRAISVVAVRKTDRRGPVYDITVDGTHCFAVGQGVFVHNTVDDVQYFKRMLHGALMVPRSFLGQDEPMQGRSILCLAGDTKVPLLDGRTRTLKELSAEYSPGEEFEVYTVGDNGKITVGKAHSPQVTKPNAEVYELLLDNGKTIKGTADHPFMLRDGSYRRLDELKSGDSLMPHYRRDSTKSRDGIEGYDMFLCPKTGKWKFTHRMAATQKWKRLLKHTGEVIHHVDFDKRNNASDNLRAMLSEDHLQLHRDCAEKTILGPDVCDKALENSRWWRESKETKELCRRNPEKARVPGGGQNIWCKSAKHRNLKSKQMKTQWADKNSKLTARTQTTEFSKASLERMKGSISLGKLKVSGSDNPKYRNDASYDHLVDIAHSYKCATVKDLTKWTGYSSCLIYRLLKEENQSYKEFAEAHLAYGFDPTGAKHRKAQSAAKKQITELEIAGIPGNHKVVSVTKLTEREDCYDFVVEGTHNYAIDAGVFVHNSNEDVRAGRVSLQVQRELKNGIERLIRTDFAARGFPNPWALDFNVMMTVPSNIYELAAMEVKNARADFAARVQPYVSAQWILDNVFKLSNEEISVIEKQRRVEADRADKMGMDPLFGAFTGGRPPSPDEQMGQLPPEALPPGAQPTGGVQQPQAGFAGPQAPPQGAPQTAWRRYDRARRLEERRDRESRKNHNQLVDILGELRQNDRRFDRRFTESQEFMKEFKAATLRTVNGRKVAMPAAPNSNFR